MLDSLVNRRFQLHGGGEVKREGDRQAVTSEAAVNGKVAVVGGDDFRVAMDFGQDDE